MVKKIIMVAALTVSLAGVASAMVRKDANPVPPLPPPHKLVMFDGGEPVPPVPPPPHPPGLRFDGGEPVPPVPPPPHPPGR